MLIRSTSLTARLARWLRESHDDGAADLAVRVAGGDIEVTRADGSDLSPTETLEVTARLAAHAVG